MSLSSAASVLTASTIKPTFGFGRSRMAERQLLDADLQMGDIAAQRPPAYCANFDSSLS
jgi:hypothetical protein